MDKKLKTASTLGKNAGKASLLAGLASLAVIVAVELRSHPGQSAGGILPPVPASIPNHAMIQTILAAAGMILIIAGLKLWKPGIASGGIDTEALGSALATQKDAFARLERSIQERSDELTRANHELSVYKRVIEETSEGIIITDVSGIIQEVNNAYLAMTGFRREDLLGQNPRIMKSNRHDHGFFRDMWHAILNHGRWEGEIWDRKKDGTIYPKWLSIDTIRNEQGQPERYVGINADITRIKQTEENLNKMAFFDSLTGLPNRVLFRDRFGQALTRAQRSRSRVALLYLDLDHFKHVNDSLGHHAGDLLLCEASNRILAQVRETDTVCRLGGDEFTVILENLISSEDAATVAKKIIECLTESFTIENSEVFVGTSIGIALFPFDGDTPEELSKRADAAMYDAKEHGRGQLRFASGESGKSSKRRLETETGLRKAMELGEFFIEYQPQVSAGAATLASSQGILGAEALIRWKPPGGIVVYPDDFIQVAEESGLIIPLGARILMDSCIEARRWLDAGRPLVVSVNASQLQFERGRIIEQVSDALKASGLPPALLKLEITESIFSRNMNRMAEIMREIKNMGVSLALDDFGTGYSSLRYIDKLPFDTLKIDKAFIQRIDSRYEGGEIATAIVSLARSFGMESIAEGVETSEQLDALRARGCDTIQGYFVSKPLVCEEFRSFVDQEWVAQELEQHP
jgi:diguanylate cyclase (GGDEF)-like protein/PAS domain S-box-containing protein